MEVEKLEFCRKGTLVQSVTSAIPSYAMLTASLPKSVTNSLSCSCLNRRFIWGGNADKRGRGAKLLLVGRRYACPA